MSWAAIAGMTRAAQQMLTAVATFTDEDWRTPKTSGH